jgi:hypothetical protein
MPGPLPKPAGTRRRRNKTASPVVLPVESGRKCPKLENEAAFLPETVTWWERLWSSPMAALYLDVDAFALERLALMIDQANRGQAGPTLLAEIRALEDRFGLSPAARRRLQWSCLWHRRLLQVRLRRMTTTSGSCGSSASSSPGMPSPFPSLGSGTVKALRDRFS